MATIVLERGHHGKIRDDRGATHAGFVEEVLVREYLRHTEDRLRELGHRPVIQSSHPEAMYAMRQARADRYKPAAYVACHINAGRGDYGAALYDGRSGWGAKLADHVANRLRFACPELARSLARPTLPGFERAQNVIDRIYASKTACGLVYEPGFIDRPEHFPLWTPSGLRRVGIALADGIDAYVKG